MKKVCRLGSLEISLVNMTQLEFWKKKYPFYILKIQIFTLAEKSYWVTIKTCFVTLLKVQFTMTIVINRSKALIISPAGKDKANQLQTKANDYLFYLS